MGSPAVFEHKFRVLGGAVTFLVSRHKIENGQSKVRLKYDKGRGGQSKSNPSRIRRVPQVRPRRGGRRKKEKEKEKGKNRTFTKG